MPGMRRNLFENRSSILSQALRWLQSQPTSSNILTATWRKAPKHNHLIKMLSIFWPTETVNDNKFLFFVWSH